PLDHELCMENSDYQAKRAGNIFLDPLTVTVASDGLFDRWLASTGKLGGQRKIPRLANDRHLIDAMLGFNNP
ncbi:MAG: GH3 auxin-responsive promoter family protein, partial [Paramuribaculum sp.]|nr:GH3 auxin-responsive promoter family protein [Paramuribaculum sp.]